MNKATATSGMLQERHALQEPEGVSSPTYISEHMQLLAQYTSALEEVLAEEEKNLGSREEELYTQHKDTMSFNAAKNRIKYETASDRSEIARMKRLCSSSWDLIGASQSRVKHLVTEAQNQI